MTLIKRAGFIFITLFLAANAFADHNKQHSIEDRIKPAGKVNMASGTATTAPTTQVAKAARTGQEIYNTKCLVCHAAGVAGAPKVGDSAAWDTRFNAVGGDIDKLVASVKKGKGAMPPMAMCMDCSDEEFRSAIDYMKNGG